MQQILPWLILGAAGLTFAVLVAGIINMVRPGSRPARANKLMQWRIALQAAAILLLLILMALVG